MAYRYFNLTNMTNAGNETTTLTFIKSVNTTLNYVPATLMLVAIYIVLFVGLIGRGFEPAKAFASTSFAMMILALIIFPMDLITGTTLIIFMILCPLSLFVLWVWGGTSV